MKGPTMRQRTTQFAATLVVLAGALALQGCIRTGVKLPPQLMTLTATTAAPAGAALSGPVSGAIIVAEPETDRRLAVQRVPVQVDAATLAYLQKAAWVERPARLFQSLLAETLRVRGSRMVFEAGDTDTRGATQLSGRLVDMGYDARSRSVVVRFDAVLENSGRTEKGVLATRRFEAVVPGVRPDAEAVAPALNRAANDVAGQVADWVG